MFLYSLGLETPQILLIIVICSVLVIAVLITVIYNITKKKKDPRKNLDVEIAQLQDASLNRDNEMYIVLSRNVTFTAGENQKIGVGPYILRSATADDTAFNIRYNGLVKEFHNEDKIVMGEGDSICCVSGSVTLIADLPDKIK